mgnify:CR=1 FL=1
MALTRINNNSLSSVTAAGIPIREGSVLQVKSTSINPTTGDYTNNASFSVHPDINVSITPSSSTNKILVMCSAWGYMYGDGHLIMDIDRSGTLLSGQNYGFGNLRDSASDYHQGHMTMVCLDSPNTTSSRTYSLAVRVDGNGSAYVHSARVATITVMEIAGA